MVDTADYLSMAEQMFALYNVGHDIQRFHAKPTIKPQSVAAHSWGVAWLTVKLHPEPRRELILACLEHDLAEGWTGDVPYGAKRRYPELKKVLAEMEDDISIQYNILNGESLSLAEEKWLKFCDMVELVLYCIREVRMGNVSMKYIVDYQYEQLTDSESKCPPELQQLLHEAWLWLPGNTKGDQQYAY